MDVSYIGKNFKTDTNVLLYMCTCILHPYNVDQVKYRQYMYIPPMVSYDIHEVKISLWKKKVVTYSKIIMPNTACENGAMTKLFKLVTHQFQNSNVSTVQRKYFNETKGNSFGNYLEH